MKLAIYNDSPIFGGHEIMTVSLIRYHLELGCEVTILLFESNEKFIGYIKETLNTYVDKKLFIKKIKYSTKSMPTVRLFFEINEVFNIWKMFKSAKFDSIIVSQGGIEQSIKGLVASFFLKIPTVSYIPYTDSLSQSGGRFSLVRDSLNQVIYRACKHYIVVHEIYKNELVNKHKRKSDNIYIVSNILQNLLKKDSYKKEKSAKDSENFTFTLLGRFYIQQKGHDLAINAFKAISECHPSAILRLVGSGPDESAIRMMIEDLGLSERVTIEEWSDDVETIYNSSDVMLMPSYFEGVSLVLLECMAFNKKIIASNIPVLKAHLNDEYLFHSGSHLSLAGRMEEAITGSVSDEDMYKCSYLGDEATNIKVVKHMIENMINV